MNFVKAGTTFLLRDRKMGTHLFIVIADPDAQNRLVVTAALVTERSHTDKTCVLSPGDHSFVRHASNVDYGSARFVPQSKIEDWLSSGKADLQANLTPDVLKRVQSGLLRSAHTINAIADHCRPLFKSGK